MTERNEAIFPLSRHKDGRVRVIRTDVEYAGAVEFGAHLIKPEIAVELVQSNTTPIDEEDRGYPRDQRLRDTK